MRNITAQELIWLAEYHELLGTTREHDGYDSMSHIKFAWGFRKEEKDLQKYLNSN